MILILRQEKEYKIGLGGAIKDTVQQGALTFTNFAAVFATITDPSNALNHTSKIFEIYSSIAFGSEIVYTIYIDDSPVDAKALHLTKEAATYMLGQGWSMGAGNAYRKYWESHPELLKAMGKNYFDVAVASIFIENAGIAFVDAVGKAMQ